MKTVVFLLTLVAFTFAASNWEVLFPNENWNKFEQKEVQLFSGVLKQKSSDGISMMQRDIHYILETKEGTVDVYAPRSSLNQDYVNKNVDIKGKFVAMELEGSLIKEILPSEIRLA
eukprot:gene9981-2300_t